MATKFYFNGKGRVKNKRNKFVPLNKLWFRKEIGYILLSSRMQWLYAKVNLFKTRTKIYI